ncbi:MAG: hypothetical protein JSU76_02890 [Dehalococcoidia bacterium]|nr:MAG: hypothetical protein JSU76_02890 [Dehalococcoidia bacterium]
MDHELILRLVWVLTSDDVKQMKAAGHGDEARNLVEQIYKLAVAWHEESRETGGAAWADIETKLMELRLALRDD